MIKIEKLIEQLCPEGIEFAVHYIICDHGLRYFDYCSTGTYVYSFGGLR